MLRAIALTPLGAVVLCGPREAVQDAKQIEQGAYMLSLKKK